MASATAMTTPNPQSLLRRTVRRFPAPVRLPLRRVVHGANRIRTARRDMAAVAGAESPILVFQMGKVGSRTVFQTMQAADGRGPVLHVHELVDLKGTGRRHVETGIVPLPAHVRTSQSLVPLLSERRFLVISGVRDPIARLVSGYFQTPMFGYGNAGHGYLGLPDQMAKWRASVEPARVIALIQAQLAAGDDGGFGDWFEKQLKPAFGVDVMASPFDRSAGFSIIEAERVELLIMQAERLSDLIPTVLADFVGTRLVEVPSNIRSQSATGSSAYREALDQLRIPRTTCELIYSRPIVRHFYDEDTINRWIDRWSGGIEQ